MLRTKSIQVLFLKGVGKDNTVHCMLAVSPTTPHCCVQLYFYTLPLNK